MIGEKTLLPVGNSITLNTQQEFLIKDGMYCSLSRLEFRVLYKLFENMGSPVSSRDLIEFAWGDKFSIDKNQLYVVINRLRKTIEQDFRHPKYVLTIHNYGYLLSA